MRVSATHRSRFAWFVLVAVVSLALTAGKAGAQVDPTWDHYKVYFTNPFPLPTPIPVFLKDQFGEYNHEALQLELFMNPTTKEIPPPEPGFFGVTNPDLHYAWWKITPQPFGALVAANNQFGDHTLKVYEALYLLNPARKNQPGGPPPENHYKCYRCEGPSVDRPVRLTDQFGPWDAMVTFPRYFCNPVEKRVPGQQPHLIVDPNQHYVCYEFIQEDTQIRTATMTDQFVVNHPMELSPSRFLCVPTYKSGVTPTDKNTWGRIKILYR